MTLSSHANSILHSTSGKVALGSVLGRGGEGVVYEIPSKPNVVAKIYHKPIGAEKTAKLEALASMKTGGLLLLTAWPTEILRSANGETCGFIMPRITACKDIHTLYNPRSRKTEFPQADWRFLIRASANTARAFAELHALNCVIGDVNPGGIAVSDRATVRLIDCDSLQVFVGTRLFSCEVGTPLFTPPELQNSKSFRGLVRTANHDNFGLAVVIFQLLFMGRHPFAGRFLGPADMGIEKAIAEFRFAYGSNAKSVQMEPPPGVPALISVSPPVLQLLERAFSREGVKGSRPTAKQWIAALETLEKQLKKCSTIGSHYYFNGLPGCPWCSFEAATGAILFNISGEALPGNPAFFDLSAAWARIIAIQSPGPAPSEPSKSSFGFIKPSNEAAALGRSAFGKAIGIVIVIGVGIALCRALPGAWVLWIIGSIFLAKTIAKSNPNRQKVLELAAKYRTTEAHYRTIKQRWDRDAGDLGFLAKVSEFEDSKQKWKDLPAVRQQRYQQLQREREKQQLERFLEKFTIDQATIPGIGASRKAVLESFNIETAFDVTHRMQVPGFGPGLTEKLLDWRRGLEQKFTFDPTQGVDPRDISALDKEISDRRLRLEESLTAGPGQLIQIRNQAITQRKVLESQLKDAYKLMLQAEADMNAAKG